jgi:hypothetical protein
MNTNVSVLYFWAIGSVVKQAIHKCYELQMMNVTYHNNLSIIHWVLGWKTLLSEICHWHSMECCSADWKWVTWGTIFFWTRRQRVGMVLKNSEVDTAWGGYIMFHCCKFQLYISFRVVLQDLCRAVSLLERLVFPWLVKKFPILPCSQEHTLGT